jgi:Flp pilus assembly protein TadG
VTPGVPAGQRGSVTVFGLGLVVLILAVGAISIDLWRVVAARHELRQDADAAAAAGANAIDVAEYRVTGLLVLDPVAAPLAARSVLGPPGSWDFTARGVVESRDGDGLTDDMVVTLSRRVDFALLGMLTGEGAVEVTVESIASPRRTGG